MDPQLPVSDILRQAKAVSGKTEVLPYVGQNETIKRNIYNARVKARAQKGCVYRKNPKTIEEIEIEDLKSLKVDIDPFLIFDSGKKTANNRILIFGIRYGLKFLKKSNHWYV